MSAFVGALLVLTATSQGSFAVTVSACRAKPNHTVQCYGAFGGSVFLHLGIDSKDRELRVKKGNEQILKYKNRIPQIYDLTNHTKYFDNGTMKLDRALKNDSGEYNIEVYNAQGRCQWNSTIQLIIQAPLSKPVISQLCLPHGEVRVSCSSDGDVTEYNWTLGHKPLDGGVAYLKDEKDTVILKKNVIEDITCSVRNDVSHNYTTVQRFSCPARTCTANGTEVTVSVKTGEDFQPLLNIKEVLISVGGSEPVSAVCDWEKINQDTSTGVISERIIFLSLAICAVIMVFVLASGMYCLNRKRNRTGIAGEGDNHTQELVYTEIVCRSRVKVGRGKEKEQETTTIYGKITAPETLDHTRGRAHGQGDVVYARVHKQNQPITEHMP